MIDYPRHSPSSLNLFAASPALFVLEHILKRKQVVGVPALRGRAIEDGVTYGLRDLTAPIKECLEVALKKYDTETALSSDPRRQQYRDTIPSMTMTALKALREYGKPDEVQGFVEWKPLTLGRPIVGYFDYKWGQHGILADLKTTEKMPSEIKINHARQVALYASSDNIDARLVYVTPKRFEIYKLENIRQHRDALLHIAMTVENFLGLADEPEHFVDLTIPDLDSFYWKTPQMRQVAFDVWGI